MFQYIYQTHAISLGANICHENTILSHSFRNDHYNIFARKSGASCLKGNCRQNFLFFFCPNTFLLGYRILNAQINDILCKTKFSTNFIWRLIDGRLSSRNYKLLLTRNAQISNQPRTNNWSWVSTNPRRHISVYFLLFILYYFGVIPYPCGQRERWR